MCLREKITYRYETWISRIFFKKKKRQKDLFVLSRNIFSRISLSLSLSLSPTWLYPTIIYSNNFNIIWQIQISNVKWAARKQLYRQLHHPVIVSSFLSNILDEENPMVSRLKEALRSTCELNPSKGLSQGEKIWVIYAYVYSATKCISLWSVRER